MLLQNQATLTNNITGYLLFIVTIIISSCAQTGRIEGGPKDKDAPKIVSSTPSQNALNFDGKKIKIDFNEYIQLKDISQQFNVSPPLKKTPKTWIQNKSLVIQFSDTLKPNTTYSFNFGNSVADNNEGNILENFEFVVSTGAVLDSMGLRGRITDANTLQPDKEPLLAMMYENLNDSAPYKEVPTYTGRSNKEGYFSINHVKPGKYKLFALKDLNFNYKYDPPVEPFAFINDIVVLTSGIIDSVLQNENHKKYDSAFYKTDSITKTNIQNYIFTDLLTFEATDKKNYIKDYTRKDRHKLDLVFNIPLLQDSFEISILNDSALNWYFKEFTPNKDSLSLWINDSLIYNSDTIKIALRYNGVDQTLNRKMVRDTLNFRFVEKEDSKKKSKVQKKLGITSNTTQKSSFDIYASPYFESEYPIEKLDISKISLKEKVDTLWIVKTFDISRDSVYQRRFYVKKELDEQSEYEIILYPGAIKSIYPVYHDTLKYTFTVQKSDYYGKMVLNIDNVKGNCLVQLIDKDKIAYQKSINKSSKLVFDYLEPKLYNIKVVYDSNNDKVWTTGDYYIKRQPEKVEIYKEAVNVRSNWDVEVNWSLENE